MSPKVVFCPPITRYLKDYWKCTGMVNGEQCVASTLAGWNRKLLVGNLGSTIVVCLAELMILGKAPCLSSSVVAEPQSKFKASKVKNILAIIYYKHLRLQKVTFNWRVVHWKY